MHVYIYIYIKLIFISLYIYIYENILKYPLRILLFVLLFKNYINNLKNI